MSEVRAKRRDQATMKRRPCVLLLGLIVLAAISTAHVADAALGESADSIASDRKSLSAVRGAVTVLNNYTIQTIESDSATVREYISPSGVVFGIAWNGLVHPDLAQLLGSYVDEYQKALHEVKHKPGRRHAQVKTGNIVVEKWGHMRNLRGRAYVPSLIPAGVTVDEIK